MVVMVVGKVLTPAAARRRSKALWVDTAAAKWGTVGINQSREWKEK